MFPLSLSDVPVPPVLLLLVNSVPLPSHDPETVQPSLFPASPRALVHRRALATSLFPPNTSYLVLGMDWRTTI